MGIGASAGGLESFLHLLQTLPERPGLAFVLVQHLDPQHASLLSEVLTPATKMPVLSIEDGMKIEVDHIYVIPPNVDLEVMNGALSLLPRQVGVRGPTHSIDFFFRSLAAEMGNRAIGVVLSGTGTDGTEGLRAIKAEDGVAFAEDPATAKFSGMPSAAVAAGVVDLVADVPGLSRALLQLNHHPHLLDTAPESDVVVEFGDEATLRKILLLVRAGAGVDFRDYKPTTIRRRLARRMAVRQASSLTDYLTVLQGDPKEARALFEDLLVNVTSFFREPEVFEHLRDNILPKLLESKPEGGGIRIWVAGCSTGEEAYSITICLLEALGENFSKYTIQIFATDISDEAINRARAGVYPDSAVREISPARLQAYFSRTERGYRINKSLRDMCVFVRHNLVNDPPFSKLDLLSCRNVLIYFNQALQSRVLAMFHFALNPSGFLLLGRSENIVDPHQLFWSVDKQFKVFSRTQARPPTRFVPPLALHAPNPQGVAPSPFSQSASDVIRQAETLLLANYAPAGVVIDAKGEIIHFRGRTGPYLEPPPGRPQNNLLKMAREGLLADLRVALTEAKSTRSVVRRPGVQLKHDGSTLSCDLVVFPLPGLRDRREQARAFVVVFEETHEQPAVTTEGAASVVVSLPPGDDSTRIEQELKATKEYLHALIVEHQHANEDLTSANEELLSSNEELQSLNEELETAKEELQSTNEELTTLNDELNNRNHQLQQVNSDLANVLNSVELPVIIVDGDRKVRRFTIGARPLMNLRAADLGRPIDEIRSELEIDLDHEIAEVIDTVTPRETEVQDRAGRWFRLRVRPYLTTDKKIDGAVVTVMDIDLLKRALGAAEWARDYAMGTVEALRLPILVLDERLHVLSANRAFYESFSSTQAITESKSLFELIDGCWDSVELRGRLEAMLAKQAPFEPFEYACLDAKTYLLAAEPVRSFVGVPMVLLSMEDITARKRYDAERSALLGAAERAQAEAEQANMAKDQFLATVSHELRTPLSSVLLQSQMLQRVTSPERLRKGLAAIGTSVKMQARLIDDLLDVSRIVTGKLAIDMQLVQLPDIVRSAVETVLPMADNGLMDITETIDDDLPPVCGDPKRLRQVVWNLLTNAIKFSPAGGEIHVTLDRSDGYARIRVVDNGLGIDPDYISSIFSRFSQADLTQTRAQGGLGLGLAIADHLVDVHGGTIKAESAGKGQGSTFTVMLPLLSDDARTALARDDAPVRDSRPGRMQGTKILIVEDNSPTREALLQMLTLSGAEVRAAQSVRQGLELFEAFRPQILISDIAMPEEDGYSLLAKVRALGPARGGDVPALALTALASEQDRNRSAAAGFQLHLAKPVDMERLVDALSSLLP
ncbi:Sensor protein EvgS precursor [Enhygromyxa salina]|uniref:Sensor protein EvgS n=1 Tax=Enhygromyxa salina TaxID=215803 RepID=A0A2S9YTI2_9BACT|nr:CheR family methyltransferase [Enhygromyxa salina]PRQ08349.1 Sensor protein EvgS precursor [Enhygromyxa salina]